MLYEVSHIPVYTANNYLLDCTMMVNRFLMMCMLYV